MRGFTDERTQDDDARRLLFEFESEASENDVERQSERLHAASVASVAVDLPDREWLERFPCEEPVDPSDRDSIERSQPRDRQSITDTDGPYERTAVPAVVTVAGVPPQPRRRSRPTLARAGITLAVLALLGLIGSTVIRVVLSAPEAPGLPLLESVGTAAIGRMVPVQAPLPIEPPALVDTASVIGSVQGQVVPSAGAAVQEPPRTGLIAPERPTTASVIPHATMLPVTPRATVLPSESPPPAQASASDSPKSTPGVLPSEPLALVPAAVDPRLGQPEPPPQPARRLEVAAAAPISAETSGVAIDRGSIEDLLNGYRLAFNDLNASAAKTLWPSVDERTLARAFDQLKRQEVVFDACQTAITGRLAVSSCHGHASFVPKVGNKVERIAGRWTFKLRKADGGWMIEGVESR